MSAVARRLLPPPTDTATLAFIVITSLYRVWSIDSMTSLILWQETCDRCSSSDQGSVCFSHHHCKDLSVISLICVHPVWLVSLCWMLMLGSAGLQVFDVLLQGGDLMLSDTVGDKEDRINTRTRLTVFNVSKLLLLLPKKGHPRFNLLSVLRNPTNFQKIVQFMSVLKSYSCVMLFHSLSRTHFACTHPPSFKLSYQIWAQDCPTKLHL